LRNQREKTKNVLHDALTGLPNKDVFFDHLTQVIALASRNKKIVAIACMYH